jgi:hypothetical protein
MPKADEPTRGYTFALRLNPEEHERAKKLAAHYGIPISHVMRMLMLEAERQIGASKKGKRS